MHFEFNREMRRKTAIYSASLIIAILAYFLVTQFSSLLNILARIFELIWPFLLGAGIAFVLNHPVDWCMERVFTSSRLQPGTRRTLSVAVVFFLFLFFLIITLAMIIPSLLDSFRTFVSNFGEYMSILENYISQTIHALELSDTEMQNFVDTMDLTTTLTTWMKSFIPQLAGYSYHFVRSLFNFLISLASAFYILMDKQNLVKGIKVLNYSLFSKNVANSLTLFAFDAKVVFEQYIVGNLLDSTVVGLICWLGCLIFHIPYAPMIGFIVGATNIIPVFGPFLGAIPVTILLLLINPISAVIFGFFILFLQQVDGNILKPIILGDKLGLSGFWILFSVTIGGALFNVIGMFLAVPVFALLYASIQDLVILRLQKKHIEITDETGIIA